MGASPYTDDVIIIFNSTRVLDGQRVPANCALFWERGCSRDALGQGYSGMGEGGAGTQGRCQEPAGPMFSQLNIWPMKARGISV